MRNKFHHNIEHYNRLVSTHMLDSIYTLTIYMLFFIHRYWVMIVGWNDVMKSTEPLGIHM